MTSFVVSKEDRSTYQSSFSLEKIYIIARMVGTAVVVQSLIIIHDKECLQFSRYTDMLVCLSKLGGTWYNVK